MFDLVGQLAVCRGGGGRVQFRSDTPSSIHGPLTRRRHAVAVGVPLEEALVRQRAQVDGPLDSLV